MVYGIILIINSNLKLKWGHMRGNFRNFRVDILSKTLYSSFHFIKFTHKFVLRNGYIGHQERGVVAQYMVFWVYKIFYSLINYTLTEIVWPRSCLPRSEEHRAPEVAEEKRRGCIIRREEASEAVAIVSFSSPCYDVLRMISLLPVFPAPIV